jgi:hypothetical protein
MSIITSQKNTARDNKGHFIKGYPHNKGIIRTDEEKEKMIKSLIGKTASDATKQKMRLARVGVVPSKETGRKISLAKTGKKRPDISGENHPLWNGGKSKGYKTGYYSAEYKAWRKAVFTRDDFTCQWCGETGYITAHHIKSFAYYPELRYEISNGITLCQDCHSKTDNYKQKAKRHKKEQ